VTCFLSTFRPLCSNVDGSTAAKRFGHPPFIDASCRREPDFESAFPSISTVCHGDKFAPRLHRGDRVAFLTVKGGYAGHPKAHRRLVAALEVVERFETHAAAAEWYRAKGLPLPSNCMVVGNGPFAVEHTTQPGRSLQEWDLVYQARTTRAGVFLVCKASYLELHEPPIILEDALVSVFGRVPGTRNPPAITDKQYAALLSLGSQLISGSATTTTGVLSIPQAGSNANQKPRRRSSRPSKPVKGC
jgi:hypothetical protein